jgi:solute carrier family 25 protein 39/40
MVHRQPSAPVSPSQQILSSCTGAVITSLFLTPFDVVKTRLQAQQRNIYGPKLAIGPGSQRLLFCSSIVNQLCICGAGVADSNTIASASRGVHYTGTLDAFLRIPRYEGFTALWRGLPPTL